MNETEAPVRHQPRRRCQDVIAVQQQSDLAVQTTDRLNALNETLRELARDSGDPYLQSKQERIIRRELRADVYAEISRLVGPADLITIAKPDGMTLARTEELARQADTTLRGP